MPREDAGGERLQKLLADRKITLKLDDTAKTWLGNKGYDPAYGARPLKRVIQKRLQDPLARQILAELKERRHDRYISAALIAEVNAGLGCPGSPGGSADARESRRWRACRRRPRARAA